MLKRIMKFISWIVGRSDGEPRNRHERRSLPYTVKRPTGLNRPVSAKDKKYDHGR